MAEQAVDTQGLHSARVAQIRPAGGSAAPGRPAEAAAGGLDRDTATAFALAYRCLADPTRILLLNRLARARQPLLVGEIVALVDVGQSTVSHHLRLLLQAGFVRVQRSGTTSAFEVNPQCLSRFPATAAIIMDEAPIGVAACACDEQDLDQATTGVPAPAGCECHHDDDPAGCDPRSCTGCDC